MSRIFDKRNYSHKTIETYEIMSAYYVDIFYNHLYSEAKKLKANGNVVSITEGYKHALNAFLKSLNNPKLYKKSIVGMHHYFMNIGFASISFSKCIDRITTEFIPTDFFQSLTTTKKMGVIRLVLNQSIKNFIRKIVDEHIGKIIDFHSEVDNVRILQDDLINCFMLEREGMYQRFIGDRTKTNKDETVNRLISEKMQVEIKRLVKEKYEQQKKIITMKKIFMRKKNEEVKTNEFIADLQNQLNSLKKQNDFYVQTQKTFTNMSNNQYVKNITKPIEEPATSDFISTNQTAASYTNKLVVRTPKPVEEHIMVIPEIAELSIEDENSPANSPIEDENSLANSQVINLMESPQSDDENIEENDSSFIEVNNNNILSIIQNDTEDLQKFNNYKMDEGTMLDEFT
jgi:hypothetical protein